MDLKSSDPHIHKPLEQIGSTFFLLNQATENLIKYNPPVCHALKQAVVWRENGHNLFCIRVRKFRKNMTCDQHKHGCHFHHSHWANSSHYFGSVDSIWSPIVFWFDHKNNSRCRKATNRKCDHCLQVWTWAIQEYRRAVHRSDIYCTTTKMYWHLL